MAQQSFWSALVLPLAIATAGLALFACARRTRRVGDHPHCRKCGFDLFGTPSDRCGECGSDLRGIRAVVVGRGRRPVVTAWAVLLMLTATIWGAKSMHSAGWFDRRPDWLLRVEVGFDWRRSGALDELAKRIRSLPGGSRGQFAARGAQPHAIAEPSVRRLVEVAGNPADFDDDCRDFLVETWYFLRPPARREAAAGLMPLLDANELAVALRAAQVLGRAADYRETGDIDADLRLAAGILIGRQGDRRRSWDNELGTLVETARRARLVDDAAWSRFGRQMLNPQLYARSRIRAGDGLPLGIGWVKPRGGGAPISVSERWDYCHVAGIELMSQYREEFARSAYASDSEQPVVDAYTGAARELPVGRHVLSAAITFRVAECDPSTLDEGRVLAEWRGEWKLPVEVVPVDADVVRPVAAPGLVEAFAKTAKLGAWMKSGTLWVTGDVGPLPTNVAARGLIEDPATGQRWDAGLHVIRGNGPDRLVIAFNGPVRREAERPKAGAVINLLLEPDPSAARRTIDVTEYADVRLRIDGVTIGSN